MGIFARSLGVKVLVRDSYHSAYISVRLLLYCIDIILPLRSFCHSLSALALNYYHSTPVLYFFNSAHELYLCHSVPVWISIDLVLYCIFSLCSC
jgi:hypothetical protein